MVQPDVGPQRNILRGEPAVRGAEANGGERHTGGGAEQSQQRAFDEQLADQAPAAAAHRQPDRDLFPSR